jgi:hypothetical protein
MPPHLRVIRLADASVWVLAHQWPRHSRAAAPKERPRRLMARASRPAKAEPQPKRTAAVSHRKACHHRFDLCIWNSWRPLVLTDVSTWADSSCRGCNTGSCSRTRNHSTRPSPTRSASDRNACRARNGRAFRQSANPRSRARHRIHRPYGHRLRRDFAPTAPWRRMKLQCRGWASPARRCGRCGPYSIAAP